MGSLEDRKSFGTVTPSPVLGC